jgi:hypothetical protein
MFSFIEVIIQVLVKFLADFFNGKLTSYLYSLSLVLVIITTGVAIYKVLSKQSSRGYTTTIVLEVLGQFALWIVAIILLKILTDFNVNHYESMQLYTMGMIVVTACNIVLLILRLLNYFGMRQKHLEISSFVIGSGLGYCMLQVFQFYTLLSKELMSQHIIILCLVCGALSLVYQFGQRELFQK